VEVYTVSVKLPWPSFSEYLSVRKSTKWVGLWVVFILLWNFWITKLYQFDGLLEFDDLPTQFYDIFTILWLNYKL